MSLKKIAEAVGVSPSTVSRVLNNATSNCASQKLRDRIWSTAIDMKYIPNQNARLLKTGSINMKPNYCISLVLGRFDSLETDPFFTELFRSIEQELFLQFCTLHNIITANQLMESNYIAPSPDGYIILGRCPSKLLEKLKKVTQNIVGVGRNPSNFNIDEIICDGREAASMAMEYLISLGHKRIAYIGDCSFESRYIGYCETLLKYNFPMDYSLIIPTKQTQADGLDAMNKLSAQAECTAALCANDATAIGAIEALSAIHWRKRRKISIISIDNTAASQSTKPMLTTINVPKEDMGHIAVRILIDRIQRKHHECLRVELPCRLIIRNSCYQHID